MRFFPISTNLFAGWRGIQKCRRILLGCGDIFNRNTCNKLF
ncbi:hypothetical protein HMPREF0971_01110 [Segatella oris F0302]|uniref:Uncharacterized protein n=1 Tax=Segatella oris F0302 TaxID=649760 RepID=D1QQ62_9BACT|nr:hypothetical protein HMPREF0971_01110 [Segatella oris F0302]